MDKLFISYSSQDDAFVRELRWALADLKQEVWIDSRELRGGAPLLEEIQKAIEESSAVAVGDAGTASTGALQQESDATALGRLAESFITGSHREFPSHREFQIGGVQGAASSGVDANNGSTDGQEQEECRRISVINNFPQRVV